MQVSELQQYLQQNIPLSLAMQVQVALIEPGEVLLRAPLSPNVNHHQTAFGGSATALAMLACWSLVHTRLHSQQVSAHLVIQRGNMEFQLPITGDFSARALLEQPQRWDTFTASLARRGKARIAVTALVQQGSTLAGRFSGEFVALSDPPVVTTL